MFGLYTYRNGLQFTGIVALKKEDIMNYLKETYGVETPIPTGERTEEGYPIYKTEKVFMNTDAFEIKELKTL